MGELKIAAAGSDWADSYGCESFSCANVPLERREEELRRAEWEQKTGKNEKENGLFTLVTISNH